MPYRRRHSSGWRATARHSRKTASGSSSTRARRRRGADVGAGLLLSVMLLGFGSAASAQEASEQRIEFDIPAQAANTALTEFAEQADLTLVFPDDVVRWKSANALIGKYTLQEGVDILLADTGLTPMFSNELVLSISADEQPTNKGKTMEAKRTPPLLKRLGTTIAAAMATISAAISTAAPDDEGDEPRLVEVIIVTAEKREESILDVPLGMTALAGDKIEQLGLTNFMDLEQVVPGLQFGDDNEQKGNGTVIRGIGTFRGGTPIHGGSQVNVDRDLAVSVSVDDVFTFAGYGLAPQLFDLERVEVLERPPGNHARPQRHCRRGQLLHEEAHRQVGRRPPGRVHRPVHPPLQRRDRRAVGGPIEFPDFRGLSRGGWRPGEHRRGRGLRCPRPTQLLAPATLQDGPLGHQPALLACTGPGGAAHPDPHHRARPHLEVHRRAPWLRGAT